MADALEQAIGKLGDHRRIGESSWEGDMPVKVGTTAAAEKLHPLIQA